MICRSCQTSRRGCRRLDDPPVLPAIGGHGRDHATGRPEHDRRVRENVRRHLRGGGQGVLRRRGCATQGGARRAVAEAYSTSPRSNITMLQRSHGADPELPLQAKWWTLAGAYERWISTREPPLFGTEPDARVWTLANEAADPQTHRDTRNRGGNRPQRTCPGTARTPGRRRRNYPEVRLDNPLRH